MRRGAQHRRPQGQKYLSVGPPRRPRSTVFRPIAYLAVATEGKPLASVARVHTLTGRLREDAASRGQGARNLESRVATSAFYCCKSQHVTAVRDCAWSSPYHRQALRLPPLGYDPGGGVYAAQGIPFRSWNLFLSMVKPREYSGSQRLPPSTTCSPPSRTTSLRPGWHTCAMRSTSTYRYTTTASASTTAARTSTHSASRAAAPLRCDYAIPYRLEPAAVICIYVVLHIPSFCGASSGVPFSTPRRCCKRDVLRRPSYAKLWASGVAPCLRRGALRG